MNEHSTSDIHPNNKESMDIRSTISISAIGDVLIHTRVYRDAKTTNGYNFMPMLDEVEPYLDSSTITIANQETMIGGEELGLSGYPAFNSPTEIADNLKTLGIDVVTLANNHSLDQGVKGIENAINYWDEIEMKHTGAFKTKDQSEEVLVYKTEKNIDVAILSYTYGTNGISAPAGKDYVVNRIEFKKMAKDIEKAKELADGVIVSLHFGQQYEPYPSAFQKEVVQFCADHEVDAVLGHHPHVLQPLEYVEGEKGNKMLTVYSLGNFFSGQEDFQRRIGGIFTFDFLKDEESDDTVKAIDPRFQITYVTSQDQHDYKVVPMAELPELMKEYKATKQHVSQWLPELSFIE
ncbi:CapA family protein [Halobacillus sp. BBL2006]|uniref:CapA family protein n=1 Tax=Halobacillus sp. BBL2006 TaxID=1543706 RepID=UPI0012E03115|nr:CapA family protein [Halobacillus sp. BBL2006]